MNIGNPGRKPIELGRRPARPQQVLTVVRTEQLSPHLVRVHLGGPGFAAFVGDADPAKLLATDKYVKFLLARRELGLTPPYDLDALRQVLPPQDMPVRRTYTVRAIDHAAGTLAVDFVVHGDSGVAAAWAATAQPGDTIALSGPGGLYSPSTDPGTTFLFLGDNSALPAIAAALEALPAEARGLALIEVDQAEDELALLRPAGVELRWLHRDSAAAPVEPGVLLVDAVEALPQPTGPVDVFAHGERSAVKAIRAVLQDRWGLERRALSLSAYWALGRAEDRFQAEKREPVGAIFAD